MNKKGFTLIELLAVITLLAIIMLLAVFSIHNIADKANKRLLEEKVMNIEKAAALWGQNHREALTGLCENKNETYSRCKEVTVNELFNAQEGSYLESEEKDANGNPIYINNVTKKDMADDSAFVYIKNNRVYAKFNCKEFDSNSGDLASFICS